MANAHTASEDILFERLFAEIPCDEAEGGNYYEAAGKLVALAGIYAGHYGENPKSLVFDMIGIVEMLRRFQRDVYGIPAFLRKLAEDGHEKEVIDKIISHATDKLSIRVNTGAPRKTRIAAVMSLWLATCRPVHIGENGHYFGNHQMAVRFCPSFNIWLCAQYLRGFGKVKFGDTPDDAQIRMSHAIHDFRCRQLGLSVLELFYCSIFRPTPTLASETLKDK